METDNRFSNCGLLGWLVAAMKLLKFIIHLLKNKQKSNKTFKNNTL